MSWSDTPAVNPYLWFVGDAGPAWLVIRAGRYPEGEAPRPADLAAIRKDVESPGGLMEFRRSPNAGSTPESENQQRTVSDRQLIRPQTSCKS